MTKFALLALALLWQNDGSERTPPLRLDRMQYRRPIAVPRGSGQACAVLDAQIFPHAQPALKDLRILISQQGVARELPYAMTLSESSTDETQPARLFNLNTKDGAGSSIAFDLEMPHRPYTDVVLDLRGRDFTGAATVSGMDAPGGSRTPLGDFTIFDLASQQLSRDTTLPLQESSFRFLHIELRISPAAGMAGGRAVVVEGAHVPPSREAQTLYTTVESVTAPTTGPSTAPGRTRYDLPLPLRVPVERVTFDLAAGSSGNFSRDVTIHASASPTAGIASSSLPLETLSGTISRVRLTQQGRSIDRQQLSLPATLGSNLQSPAHVWIEVDNGGEHPLPIAAVRLEMRERKICFEAPQGDASIELYYGDPALAAPLYSYARQFTPSSAALEAQLGPEQGNPQFRPTPLEDPSFNARYPEAVWIGIIAVICVLGVVALRSSRNVGLKR